MSKEDCPFCQLINDKSEKLYEDDKVVAVLNRMPSAYGHILVMPKEHYPIIEQVPDFIISHLFTVVNKISMAIFEALNIQGTNILVNNGIEAGQEAAHFMVNIIPRSEGDGLDFTWTPKKLGDEEMSIAELQIKEEAGKIGEFEQTKGEAIDMDKDKEVISEEDGEEESYLLRHIRRIP